MSTVDRQRRAGRELRQADLNDLDTGGPRAPVRDVPLGPPGVDLNPADPDEPVNDAPFSTEDFEAAEAANQLRDIKPEPVGLQSPEEAMELANILQDPQALNTLGQEMYDSAFSQLNKYVGANPELVEEFRVATEQNAWEEEWIDRTPQTQSRLVQAQRDAVSHNARALSSGIVGPDTLQNPPKSIDELPPLPRDSREFFIERLESEGVDTTSGIGGFWDNVGFAIRLNDSEAQRKAILGVAMDNVELSGATLPPGKSPITYIPELGEYEVLMPTEDGKLRRTLVKPEVFGLKAAGHLFDIEEGMAALYTGAAILRGGGFASKHPFITELMGDYAGRNVGIMLESMISAGMGEADLNDIANAFSMPKNVAESGINTLASRGLVRIGRVLGVGRLTEAERRAGPRETAEVIDRNIEEAAEVVNDIGKLTEGTDALPLTVESGSLSARGAQAADSRGRLLSSKNANNLEEIRRERIATMGVANKRVAERHSGGTSMEYDSHDLAEAAVATVNTQRQLEVKAARDRLNDVQTELYNPTTGSRRYFFNDDAPLPVGEGEVAGDVGIEVISTEGRTHIVGAFAGKRSQGNMDRLMDRVLEDAGDGSTITFGDSVSKSAQRSIKAWERRGFKFEVNPGTSTDAATGALVNLDNGVYTLVSRPGEFVAPRIIADANYDRAATEAGIEAVEDLVVVAQARLDDTNSLLRQQIGWSEQKQTSNFYLNNTPQSGLMQGVRRLQNKINQSLTGAEESEAGKALAIAVKRTADEDGNTVLTGLADRELDVGNLLTARDRLGQIAAETGDQDIAGLVGSIDNLLAHQSYINKTTGKKVPAQTAAINESIERAQNQTADLNEAVALANSSRMFKRNVNGELVNTDLAAMGRTMSNGSVFMQHMEPLLRVSPDLQVGARDALGQIYRETVLGGTGWTPAKHGTFLKNYSTAIKSLYGADEAASIAAVRPPSQKSLNRLDDAKKRREDAWTKTIHDAYPDAELAKINSPADLIGTMGKHGQGVARSRRFMADLERFNPEMHQAVKDESIKQTEQLLHRTYFDISQDASSLSTGVQLRRWFDDSKDLLQSIHGEVYVRDLETVVRAAELDAKRLVLKGKAPETQHDLIRVTRSILGPLSRPQRQITAGNYINHKRLAAQVLRIYSDPASLRQLRSAGRAGMRARTDAGVAVLSRLGLFQSVGIPIPENIDDPSTWPQEFRAQVNEVYDWIDHVAEVDKEEAEEE